MVAAPAVAQNLPPVPTPSLPAIPTVVPSLPKPPALPTPSAPSAPSVPIVPSSPSVPSVPRVGSPGGSSQSIIPTGVSGGGASGGGGSGGSAGGGGRVAGGGSRGGGSGSAASAGRAGGGNGAGTGRQGGSGSAAARAAHGSARERRAEVRRDRRLRAMVRPLEGCVGALPRAEGRVLTLRAGLGSERPQTRRRVAQILRVSTRRVTRLERRGVRRLHVLVRAGRCSASSIPAGDIGGGTLPDQAAALGALAATGVGAGSLAVFAARELKGSSGSHSDRIEVKSERESSSSETAKTAPLADGEDPVNPPPSGAIVERGGTNLTLPLLIVVAVVALGMAAEVRRVLRARPPE